MFYMAQQGFGHFVKAVHVELAHKARHVAVFKVFAQCICKLLSRRKGESVAHGVAGPPDKMCEAGVMKHAVEFVHKGIFLHWRVVVSVVDGDHSAMGFYSFILFSCSCFFFFFF